MDEQALDDVIGPEIPRAKCTLLDASDLNTKNHDGHLILNCNARGFRSNLENIREFIQTIRNPARMTCKPRHTAGNSFTIHSQMPLLTKYPGAALDLYRFIADALTQLHSKI